MCGVQEQLTTVTAALVTVGNIELEEEEARKKAEKEAKRAAAEEEARRRAEEEARKKAEEEARLKVGGRPLLWGLCWHASCTLTGVHPHMQRSLVAMLLVVLTCCKVELRPTMGRAASAHS
jgi:sRNA-binding protein